MSNLDKNLRVTMPDGSVYDVPVKLVVENRTDYYVSRGEKREDVIAEVENDDYEITDWAANNMDWEDVSEHAVCVSGPEDTHFQEGWVNGPKEIV